MRLASHKSLEYPELFRDCALKIYNEKNEMRIAYSTPSIIHKKKFVKLKMQFSCPMK